MEGVFTIQEEISLAIADNLKVTLLGLEKAVIVKRPTENLEAYNLALKGKYYHEMLTPEGLHKAIKLYEQALHLDPNFALAYVWLAEAYFHLVYHGGVPPVEAYPRASEYANKALEIDNTIAEAYSRLGSISMDYDWDWEAAERYFKQALQLNPNLAFSLSDYSILLTHTGRNEEAIPMAIRAQERDPLSLWSNYCVGYAYYCDHQYDRAIEVFQMTLAMYPNYAPAHYSLGAVYGTKLMYKEAIAAYERAVELSDRDPSALSLLAYVYYEFGEKSKAGELFDIIKQRSKDEYVPPSSFYIIHKARGDEDLAYKWFEQAVKERDSLLLWVINSPIAGVIPDEPRYNTLLKKVGLEKYQH